MKRAFTMVEMLVAMALLILLVGLGLGITMNTLKAKKFQAVYDGLVADLQMAKSNAVAGKTDSSVCVSQPLYPSKLVGWGVSLLTANPSLSYKVFGQCQVWNGSIYLITDFPLAPKVVNVSPITISYSPQTAFFKPLGLGTQRINDLVITLSYPGTDFSVKTITVKTSGAIEQL